MSAVNTQPARRWSAAGKKINVALTMLAIVGLYVGWVLLTPRITAYELRGAVKPVCVQLMRQTIFTGGSDTKLDWKKEWSRRYRSLGIQLRDDQWDFRVSHPCGRERCTCTGEAIFELNTPWYLLADFFEMPKYKSVHHVKLDVDYKSHY